MDNETEIAPAIRNTDRLPAPPWETRGLWATPRPAQLFEQALEENLERQRQERPSIPRGLPEEGYQDDYWMPEPPLVRPEFSNSPYDFLEFFPKGIATLTYNDSDGNLISIHDLNLEVIAERSLIIAASFEHSDRHAQLHLDVLSPLAAMPFLRYLYTGTYDDGQAYHEVPTSLLLHCQLYFFGSNFDMPDLKSQALINVLRQCEFACCSPNKPIDLCIALAFCYQHVDDNRRVIDEIIEYCIERFADHKLGADEEFRTLAFDHRPFYSDLARACRKRGFQDEAAIDIIRMPYNAQSPAYYASMEDATNPRFKDIVHHFHGNDDASDVGVTSSRSKGIAYHFGEKDDADEIEEVRTPTLRPGQATPFVFPPTPPPTTTALTLALRGSRTILETGDAYGASDQASSSEDEGFQLVRPVSTSGSSSNLATPTSADSDFVLVIRPGSNQHIGPAGNVPTVDDLIHGLRTIQDDSDAASSDSDWTLA